MVAIVQAMSVIMQGPALLVRNDAVFTEADFQSISRVGDSVKRGQAGKTGASNMYCPDFANSTQRYRPEFKIWTG